MGTGNPDELAGKIAKLPQWARQLIGRQQATIARLESANRTNVTDPWLWGLGSDLRWNPIAGAGDFQVRVGADPSTLAGQCGLTFRKMDPDKLALDVAAVNGTLLVAPQTMNSVQIVLVRDDGYPDSDLS